MRQDQIAAECEEKPSLRMPLWLQMTFVSGHVVGSLFNFAFPNGAMTFGALFSGFALAAFGSWKALFLGFLGSICSTAFSAKPYSGFSFGAPLMAFSTGVSAGIHFLPLALSRLLCVRRNQAPPLRMLAVYPCLEVVATFAMSRLLGLGQSGQAGLMAFRFRLLNKAVLPWVGLAGMNFVLAGVAALSAMLFLARHLDSPQRKRLHSIAYRAALVLAVLVAIGELSEMNEASVYDAAAPPSVRVASVIFDTDARAHSPQMEALYSLCKPGLLRKYYEARPLTVNWTAFDADPVHGMRFDAAFEATRKAASTGARIVLWSEMAVEGFSVEGDEGLIALAPTDKALPRAPRAHTKFDLLRRASATARELGVSLAITYNDLVISSADEHMIARVHNRLAFFDPRGHLVVDYIKRHLVPFNEDTRTEGTEPFPIVTLPASDWLPAPLAAQAGTNDCDLRVGLFICYDGLFQEDVADLARRRPNIMLSPSWDWKTLSPYNSQQTGVRVALESGASFLRASTRGGIDAWDQHGQQIVHADYFRYPLVYGRVPNFPGANETQVDALPFSVVVDMPTRTVPTLFPLLFPAFEWLCGAFVLSQVLRAAFTHPAPAKKDD